MPHYHYKRFELFYTTHFNKKTNFYEIHGTVTLNNPERFAQEFQTENSNRGQGIIKIKTLMEDFINFEWSQSFNPQNIIKIDFS